MIKKEVLKPIGKFQAILPVILGGICVPISGGSGIGLLYAFKSIGVTGDAMQALPASFYTAFFMAGGVEELFKFLAIIITLVVLKNKVNNVYEYILLGAAVGFGLDTPWVALSPPKLYLFITPAYPLPREVPVTSTNCPTTK